ncbi:SMI1/KNR4 family protein [Anaerotignum propionicum]|uniref:SMI1/KNR4 family protein n=1 Tax=Anaerotignum propionicum TaxID=28446 RepID=UPI00210D4994|nr:SMI1/KNR4 family protein [Anaerotignum propionicum]MCQ4935947.1 SMI1/KNR4 family protein [Anaerotignum propionicum]
MSIEYVHEIINKIKNKKLYLEGGMEENETPTSIATEEMINEAEDYCKIRLPDSFRTFLKEFSNGNLYMYGVEPLVGVGLESKLCSLSKYTSSLRLLSIKDFEKECYIVPQDKLVKINQLVPFTFGNADQLSIDHWVFICDREYPNNEYPVGYITQGSHNIVCVLESFEKWLEIFWEGNKDLDGEYQAVISILFPDYHSLMDLLDAETKEELISIYPQIIETNKENLIKYGVYQK